MSKNKFTSETQEEYQEDAERYFRNLGTTKNPGPSADSALVADKFLPSKEKEQQNVDRLTKGFDKTSRSGSFTDNPNAAPAIFPSGLKFASDFIDEMTPGKYKPEAPAKPPVQRTGPVGNAPKAAAVVTEICIDCLEVVDQTNLVPWMRIMTSANQTKLFSMGLKFGDVVLGVEHKECFDKGNEEGKLAIPLALVRGGTLTSEEDIRTAQKYNLPLNFHDGQEITLGQWNMHKRCARLEENLENYLIALDKKSEVYAINRKTPDVK